MMATKQKDKERVQFDFYPDAIERLEALQEKTGATSRAEVVRAALRVYDWLINDVDPEGTIKVFDSKDDLNSSFKIKLLLK